jgi:hypothetical protein
MKVGDVSRQRRFADPVRQRWYAYHRAVRFAVRMGQAPSLALININNTPMTETQLSLAEIRVHVEITSLLRGK